MSLTANDLKLHGLKLSSGLLIEDIEPLLKRKKEKVEELLRDIGVPERFVSLSYNRDEKKLNSVTNSPKDFFIWGKAGTGKTTFTISVLRKKLEKTEWIVEEAYCDPYICGWKKEERECPHISQRKVYHCKKHWRLEKPEKLPSMKFVPVPSLFRVIRECFQKGLSDTELMERYMKVDLLVLDDLGTEKATDWTRQILYELVDYRYGFMKRTLFTSNFPIENLHVEVGERISSRIIGSCQILKLQEEDERMVKKI